VISTNYNDLFNFDVRAYTALHLCINVFIFKNEFSLQEENCCLKEKLEVTEAELSSRLARSQEVN
jgi:hypothetical protein